RPSCVDFVFRGRRGCGRNPQPPQALGGNTAPKRIRRRRRWEEEIPSYPGMGPTEPLLAGNLRVLASASMSIDYYGHCSSPIEETQKRIAFLRRKNPNWFGGMMELTD